MKIQCKYSELVDPDKLTENPKNPNKHSDDQINRLSKLIDHYGFRHPIIVSKLSNTVIAGHGRLAAAKVLKLGKVPVDYQTFKDEDEEYMFMVSDNAIQSDWAELDLKMITSELDNIDYSDIELFGFKDLEEPKEFEKDEDEVPTNVKPRTKLGDLYQLGEHRLLCGDCTKDKNWSTLLGKNMGDLLVTSPPYDNEEEYEVGKSRGDFKNLISGFILATSDHLNNNRYVAINMGNRVGLNNIYLVQNSLEDMEYQFLRRVVWKKPDGAGIPCHGHTHKNPIGLNWNPMMVTEEVVIYSKGDRREKDSKHKFNTNLFSDYYTDCWQFRGVVSDKKQGHPAAFPMLLPELCIEFLSVPGDIVLEPFCGSGTTILACEKTDRKCFATELNPFYCDVIVKRWEDYTGKKAVKLN